MCNEQVLNLFLALLLSNFGSSNLSAPTADNDTNKIAEAIDRIARFVKWIKRNVLYLAKMMRAKLTNQISDQAPGEGPSNSWKEGLYPIRSLAVCAVQFVALFFSSAFHFFQRKKQKKMFSFFLRSLISLPVDERKFNLTDRLKIYEEIQRDTPQLARSILFFFGNQSYLDLVLFIMNFCFFFYSCKIGKLLTGVTFFLFLCFFFFLFDLFYADILIGSLFYCFFNEIRD